MKRSFGVVVMLVACFVATRAQQPPPQGNYFGSGSSPLSASVYASHFSWQADEIGLIVLWRGEAGWYSPGIKSGGSGNAAGYTGYKEFGSTRIEFSYNRSQRIARIGGVEVSMPEGDNVLLVDGVDRPGGLSAKSIRADLTFQAVPGPAGARPRPLPDIRAILQRSEEVMGFLRCDGSPADSRTPKRSGFIC